MTGLLDKLRLLVLTIVFAAVATAAPRAQELLFWPYTLDGASGYLGRSDFNASLSDAMGSDGSTVNGLSFQPPSPLFDAQWADFTSELNKSTGEGLVLKNARTLSTDAPNRFLVRGSRLGIQTEKSVRCSPSIWGGQQSSRPRTKRTVASFP